MFANFGRYARFIVRRERITSLIWIAALVCAGTIITAMYPSLFPTQEALMSMSMTMNNPSMIAMMGPVYGMEMMSPAIAMAQECLIWFAITAIVMNIFFVNRHTRTDEELGRHDMLVSLPVGRLTGSAATLFSAFILNIIISLLTAATIIMLNIEGTTTSGAFCYALSIGLQGFLFAALTLLTAQLFSTARGSMGVSFGMMGLFYMMRAIGDMNENALSYLSPLGLGLKVETFYTDAFWPVMVLFVEAIAVSVIALIINAKRDVGEGVIPAKKGRAHASRFLQTPMGLIWRLSKNTFIVWAISIFILGASYGSVVGELDTFIKGNDSIRQMLEASGNGTASLVDSFVSMLCGIMAMIIAIPVVGVIVRLRQEEKRGRLDQIYACSVSRSCMFISAVLIAVGEAVVLTFLSVTGLYAASAGSGLLVFDVLLGAAYVQLSAIFVMSAITALLMGILPKAITFIWALFGYSFLMLYFGRLFDVPEWATRLSPFGNVPQLPIEEFRVAPVIALCAVSVILYVVGFGGYRRRDIY